MKDLLLDSNGDLLLNSDGDIQFTDSIEQAIEIRMRWFANEWKLGPSLGIPYYDEVFIKIPSEELIEEKLRDAISDIDDIEEIVYFNTLVDKELRKIKISYSVLVRDNAIEGSISINV